MKNKKKRVREITDYIKFVFPMLVLYILFFIFPLFQTIGYSFTDYNGNLTSKQCGSVGGEMVKRMVEQYENGIK